MTPDRKYRVTCVKDFVGTVHSSEPIENNIIYLYVNTLDEAIGLTKGLVKNGSCQSETGDGRDITVSIGGYSLTVTNPNLAAVEFWDEDEQDWLLYVAN